MRIPECSVQYRLLLKIVFLSEIGVNEVGAISLALVLTRP